MVVRSASYVGASRPPGPESFTSLRSMLDSIEVPGGLLEIESSRDQICFKESIEGYPSHYVVLKGKNTIGRVAIALAKYLNKA